MKRVQDYKIIFHLTSTNNFESLLEFGLLPRAQLNTSFYDIADQEIIQLRRNYKLDEFIPFHFFPKNPFDGRVQQNNPNSDFMFLTLNKRFISLNKDNFYIIPSHPLHLHKNKSLIIYEYDDGVSKIDWQLMNLRDFNDHECKQTCMAECLTDININIKCLNSIVVKNNIIKCKLENALRLYNKKYGKDIDIHINIIPQWFL